MVKSQYNELFEFLSERFTHIDKRFEQIDQRFEQIDQRFDKVEERLNRLEVGQDYIFGELKALRQESVVSGHRSQRMESWIIRAAKKIDLPYNI